MRHNRELTIDLTPIVDVVFILLIFFIVTSVFKKEELALLLNLPSSSAEKLEVEHKDISIEIGKEKLAFEGQKLSFKELTQKIEAIENKKQAIILRIDKAVTYERLVKVLDKLQKNNLYNMVLVTAQPAK
jgi:biopolymer transport protein ExbD